MNALVNLVKQDTAHIVLDQTYFGYNTFRQIYS